MPKITTEEIIERCKKAHGDRYDYSETVYVDSKTKIRIICKEHGPFEQWYHLHTKGSHCPECQGLKRLNTDSFIKKAKEVHGDKFDYSKVVYKNNKTDVTIICPSHGEFSQKPNNHLSGHGCTYCGNNLPHTTEEFIAKAKKVHGDTYIYAESKYKGLDHKVSIICREHGRFSQTAHHHIKGAGCPKCSDNYKLDTNTFISRAKETHGDRYDYSEVEYSHAKGKVKIGCYEHGYFMQACDFHLQGGGCPDCGGTKPHTNETFIEKAQSVHGDRYDYSKVEYVNSKNKLTVICPDHGEFVQMASTHTIAKAGCPKCACTFSKAEQQLADTLESHGLTLLRSNRSILKGLELDIVIPEKKIAIEYNGIYWHSEEAGKDRHYHLGKTKSAAEAGYRLIHVWEDDFNQDPDREINFILNACGVTERKSVYARKTEIKEVPKSEAVSFLNKYHIQGSVGCSERLGTYLDDELVSVTLFTKRAYGYELVRHASKLKVIGGLGKVVKHFHRKYNTEIHSFCDMSRHDGKSYEAAGFTKQGELKPDYKYVVNGKREHKFGFRRASIAVKFPEVYSESKSESQMMSEVGIPKVWDCGKKRYVFK